MSSSAVVHLAYVLYALAFFVRDILWLRALTVVAGGVLVPYFLFNHLIEAALWNALFTGINLWHIQRLLIERRPIKLSDAEAALYARAFRALRPREFKRLVGLGRWSRCEAGEALVRQGTHIDQLHILLEGELAVVADGEEVAAVGPGDFFGEMSFLSGRETTADVVARTPGVYLHWTRDRLREFLARQPELESAFRLILGTDLATKLSERRRSVPQPAPPEPPEATAA